VLVAPARVAGDGTPADEPRKLAFGGLSARPFFASPRTGLTSFRSVDPHHADFLAIQKKAVTIDEPRMACHRAAGGQLRRLIGAPAFIAPPTVVEGRQNQQHDERQKLANAPFPRHSEALHAHLGTLFRQDKPDVSEFCRH
jgi:hypothetical protein